MPEKPEDIIIDNIPFTFKGTEQGKLAKSHFKTAKRIYRKINIEWLLRNEIIKSDPNSSISENYLAGRRRNDIVFAFRGQHDE